MLLRQLAGKKRLFIIVPVLVILLGLGFLMGAAAGSAEDPLVTRTWVDKYIDQQITALETKIEKLEAQLGGATVELWLGKTEAKVNGENRTMDVPLSAVNSRTMVPLRFVGEALGAQVDWDNTAKKVTYTRGDRVVVLKMGAATATVNGETKTMDTAPAVIKERMLVPVRFVSEALGANVDWDNTAKKVTISY